MSAAARSIMGATLAVVVLMTTSCSAATEERAAPARHLDILLTNDDGWDAEGISVLYDALVARHHRVTLVGPATNQSGASMSTTPGSLTVTRPDPDEPKYAVTGSPVDAVTVGMTGILKSPPDLVVSGTNRGANVAYNVNYSGTVGAATAAAEHGIPAIAVSADSGSGEDADYTTAATTVTALVDELAGSGHLARLAGDGLLNVNIPARSTGGARGLRLTEVGEASPWKVSYRDAGDGTYAAERSYDPTVGAADDDAQALAKGFVTVSWLTPERGSRSIDDLRELLDGFSVEP